MFDIGFSELALIGVVALLVVGPKKLPELARTAGLWLGKARSMITAVKADIDRELKTDELRKLLTEQQSEVNELRKMLTDTHTDLQDDIRKVTAEPLTLSKTSSITSAPEPATLETSSATPVAIEDPNSPTIDPPPRFDKSHG